MGFGCCGVLELEDGLTYRERDITSRMGVVLSFEDASGFINGDGNMGNFLKFKKLIIIFKLFSNLSNEFN